MITYEEPVRDQSFVASDVVVGCESTHKGRGSDVIGPPFEPGAEFVAGQLEANGVVDRSLDEREAQVRTGKLRSSERSLRPNLFRCSALSLTLPKSFTFCVEHYKICTS